MSRYQQKYSGRTNKLQQLLAGLPPPPTTIHPAALKLRAPDLAGLGSAASLLDPRTPLTPRDQVSCDWLSRSQH